MTAPLGCDWCQSNLDAELQKYVHEPPPVGFGIVYAIVKRSGNQKAYIGKTEMQQQGVQTRFWGHQFGTYGRAKSAIHMAIQKNGVDAFRLLVLALVPSGELSETEKRLIVKFGTLSPGGYNLRAGGEGGLMSDKARQNMRDAWKDPVIRAKHVAGSKRAFTPENKQKLIEGIKNMPPEARQASSAKMKKTKLANGIEWRAKRDATALETVLPHEPNVDSRIDGAYYLRPSDGSIRRWSAQSRRFDSKPIPKPVLE